MLLTFGPRLNGGFKRFTGSTGALGQGSRQDASHILGSTNSQGGTSTRTVFAADCVHGFEVPFEIRPAHVGFLAAPTDPLLPTYLHTHTRPQETKGAFGPNNSLWGPVSNTAKIWLGLPY